METGNDSLTTNELSVSFPLNADAQHGLQAASEYCPTWEFCQRCHRQGDHLTKQVLEHCGDTLVLKGGELNEINSAKV